MLDVAKYPIVYRVFTKAGEKSDADKMICLLGEIEDKFFGKPEILILPYKK